jgi:hypothetical protein
MKANGAGLSRAERGGCGGPRAAASRFPDKAGGKDAIMDSIRDFLGKGK